MTRIFRIISLHEVPPTEDEGESLFVGREVGKFTAKTPRGAICKFRWSSACASRGNHPIVVALAEKDL